MLVNVIFFCCNHKHFHNIADKQNHTFDLDWALVCLDCSIILFSGRGTVMCARVLLLTVGCLALSLWTRPFGPAFCRLCQWDHGKCCTLGKEMSICKSMTAMMNEVELYGLLQDNEVGCRVTCYLFNNNGKEIWFMATLKNVTFLFCPGVCYCQNVCN